MTKTDREKMIESANAAEIPSSKALQDGALTGAKNIAKETSKDIQKAARDLGDAIPTDSIEARLGKDPKAT